MIMLLLILTFFAVGIGAIGMALLFFFARRDMKIATYSLVVGVVLLLIGFFINENRPAVEGNTLITVEKIEITNATDNNLFYCHVIDEESGISYRYEAEKQNQAKIYCEQFEMGSDYEINYRYEDEQYYFRN
jgi:energy-coupling factor transporter transmembrane protein EcfT